MTTETRLAMEHHLAAARHLYTAAEHNERAAERYQHGVHAVALEESRLAHSHMEHAGSFMSDAAKLHAESHGGNRHTVTG